MRIETTYNKYKRQNKELKQLFSIETQDFILDRKDFQNRINYLKKCMIAYKKNKDAFVNKGEVKK